MNMTWSLSFFFPPVGKVLCAVIAQFSESDHLGSCLCLFIATNILIESFNDS